MRSHGGEKGLISYDFEYGPECSHFDFEYWKSISFKSTMTLKMFFLKYRWKNGKFQSFIETKRKLTYLENDLKEKHAVIFMGLFKKNLARFLIFIKVLANC